MSIVERHAPPSEAVALDALSPATEGTQCTRPAPVAVTVKQGTHAARAWAARGMLSLSSRCPLGWLHAFAGALAPLASVLPTRATRVARANVKACFPELAPAAYRRFVIASLEQSMCMVTELGHLWRRPIAEVLAHVCEVRGTHHFENAMQRGKGVLLASPHLGAWELSGLWFASRYPMTTLYRAPRVSAMEPIYSAARRRSGAVLHSADATGIRALYSALGRGEVVGLLPDQDPGRGKGAFAPFFGVQANTSTLLPRIALRSQASVLFTFAERLPHGAGYRIHIRPGSEQIADPDLERGAAALNQEIEACVRLAPLQYLWTYKRFRVRPPGCADLYGKPRRGPPASP